MVILGKGSNRGTFCSVPDDLKEVVKIKGFSFDAMTEMRE